MKFNWFKRVGLVYIPKNIAGWFIVLAGIALAIYRFIAIDRMSHSASDTLRPFIINLLLIFAAYTLIAFLAGYLTKKR